MRSYDDWVRTGDGLDAFSHNLHVGVPQECVYDRSVVSHAASLFDIDSKYGDVLPIAAVQTYLRTVADADAEDSGDRHA